MKWLALGLVLAACQALQEPDRHAARPFSGRGFTAIVQADVLNNVVTPTPGVTLYDFHIGSTPLLFAYVGDTPGYPHFAGRPDREAELELPSGLHGSCRALGSSRECLITLGPTSPKRLHVWYEKLDAPMVQRADAIIQTLAPAGS